MSLVVMTILITYTVFIRLLMFWDLGNRLRYHMQMYNCDSRFRYHTMTDGDDDREICRDAYVNRLCYHTMADDDEVGGNDSDDVVDDDEVYVYDEHDDAI